MGLVYFESQFARISEWGTARSDGKIMLSPKMSVARAQQAAELFSASLQGLEPIRIIAPASNLFPQFTYVAATDRRILAGNPMKNTLDIPLAEIEIHSKRNLNSWSRLPDTLVICHGDREVSLKSVPSVAHPIFAELVQAVRHRDYRIFYELAEARERTYPSSVEPSPYHVNQRLTEIPQGGPDMDLTIDRLQKLSELRNAGVLSDSEFLRAKAKLGF